MQVSVNLSIIAPQTDRQGLTFLGGGDGDGLRRELLIKVARVRL